MSTVTLQHEVITYSIKDTAAALRRALKTEFPGVKFSVRMDRGSAYGWFRVEWTDGPTWQQARPVIDRFQSYDFDHQHDVRVPREPVLLIGADGHAVEHRYCAVGIVDQRDYSPQARAWGEANMPAEFEAVMAKKWPHFGRDLAVTEFLSSTNLTGVTL